MDFKKPFHPLTRFTHFEQCRTRPYRIAHSSYLDVLSDHYFQKVTIQTEVSQSYLLMDVHSDIVMLIAMADMLES